MRKVFILIISLAFLLASCAPADPEPQQYTATFLTLFDTVTTIVGRAESREAFEENTQAIHDDLLYYHRLFDIYNDYEGINNLKTVNDNAGKAPVKVDEALIRLISDCYDYYALTDNLVNVAMGSVLRLWHEARNDGINDPSRAKLPDMEKLQAASTHADFSSVIIDAENSTLYISDPLMSLDVGAIAKGWSAQRAAENAPSGLLISVGGNVCATGPKAKDTPWVIGVADPDNPDSNLHTIFVESGCVVTSGDYQRAYTVDGKSYHHIIDPKTLMPARYWRSVTIVCGDSGLADALSTALFLMPLEEGRALAEKCGAQALWVDITGEEFMTPGFEQILRT